MAPMSFNRTFTSTVGNHRVRRVTGPVTALASRTPPCVVSGAWCAWDFPAPPWVDELPLSHDEIGLAIRAYVEADRAFIEAIVDGSAPVPGLAEALVAHQLVEAAYLSAERGGTPIDVA